MVEIKANPKLKTIPGVVLTTSHTETDVVDVYDLYANCYIVKPVGFDNFVEAVNSTHQF